MNYLVKLEVDLVSISLNENSETTSDYFEIIIELNENLDSAEIKDKLKNRFKIVDFVSLTDVYKN